MISAIDFVSGCVGGAAGVLIGHPFDTVKVIMQTNSAKLSIMGVLRKSTFGSLYKGIKAPLTGLAGINAIIFGVHGSIMRFCPNESKSQTIIWCTWAGLAAGFAQSIISCPMELVKTRAQISGTSVMDCTKHILFKEGGVRGMFRGMTVTTLRDCPAFGLYFASYELLLDMMRQENDREDDLPSTWALLAAGGTAGAISWLSIYPLDVLKSRIQADLKYPSMRACLKDVIKNEGASALMRGMSPTMIRAFPTNAATFAVVTWTLYSYERLWGAGKGAGGQKGGVAAPAPGSKSEEILD